MVTNYERKFVWVLLTGLLFTGFEMGPLQARPATATHPTRNQVRAVALMRLLNTAEVRYNSKYQHYATRRQLLKSRIPQEITAGHRIARIEQRGLTGPPPDLESANPAPGYSFDLYVSPDGSHYLASLRPSSRNGPCGISFYTDQSGVIQLAKPLGCK